MENRTHNDAVDELIWVIGAIKDKGGIRVAKFTLATSFRNSVTEMVIIKAANQNEATLTTRTLRVRQWLVASLSHLKPLFSLTLHMNKTRSYLIALKGLMPIHGIFCYEVLASQKTRRLQFDLSDHTYWHYKSDKVWGFNAFVCSYSD